MSGNDDDIRQRLRRSAPNFAQEALDTCIERLAAERALADDLADVLMLMDDPLPDVQRVLARYREARER